MANTIYSLLHPPVYINWMRFISPYYVGLVRLKSIMRQLTFATVWVPSRCHQSIS